ncbi:phosphatidate cytidylyltransferase [Thioalkalivibrio denitrificans]|uniref:Phosphatidate cytidylyltransferase n=1 Tax=Thioalkalivibrio denitrificans TaxID=108003 RepID=A0A1V3NQZ9_9GAMM|nr:phosphatidate cytidylyltransferase [Thioalkalivibrio denitrificans]OOG27176.1 phosphatidate cytidylyltransferase [Thioalkalivibrio denitrificans]
MSGLRQRVVTGAALAAGLLAAILLLPTALFLVLILLVLLLAAWEWTGLMGVDEKPVRLLYLGLCLVLGFVALDHALTMGRLWPVVAGVIWWALVLVLLAVYQPGIVGTGRHALKGVAGVMTLVPACVALLMLHAIQPAWLVFLFLLTACADSAAYFTGKRFGRSKLAPHISPGKTREGLFGALGVTLLLGLAGAWYFEVHLGLWFYFVALCLVTALLSVAGDLFESLMKREAGVKDSGEILPGHGGVMDRIDSVTAAAPVFLFGLLWAGILVR